MNRRFRGKGDNGKWLYGGLVEHYDGSAYIHLSYEKLSFSVDKKSVGQFVGVEDVNEIDIYVGDIVLWTSDHKTNFWTGAPIPCNSYEVGEVVYSVDETRYEVLVRKQQESCYGGQIPYSRVLQFYNWKVIGNITDNPEIFDGCKEGTLKVDGSVV
jgi:hypothetical protein